MVAKYPLLHDAPRGRPPPIRVGAPVGGIGPPPVRTLAQAETVLGVLPLQCTPASLPIEGLRVCCETAAPGGGLWFSSTVHHRPQGSEGQRGGGGREEGHSGLCGRAARCPHAWVRARGTRPAPCGAAATPPRMRGPRALRARVPVLRRWLGRLRGGGGVTAYHTAYTRGMEASTAPAAGSGSCGRARGLSPRRRHLTLPPWVIPTQCPPEHSASSSHPSTRSTGECCSRSAGGGFGAADGEGTHVPGGCQHGGDLVGLRALPLMEAGDRQRELPRHTASQGPLGARGPDTDRPWGTRCRAVSPQLGSAPMSVQWRKHPMRMSSKPRWLGNRPSRAWSAKTTAARDLSVRGWSGASARLTSVSWRWRAGAGLFRATQRPVRCS